MGTEIQDFSPSSGFITFQNGESVKQLNVSVVSDKVVNFAIFFSSMYILVYQRRFNFPVLTLWV